MNEIEINDVRKKSDFKGKSFSGYKLADVKNELLKELKKANFHDSIYWIYELLCSAHMDELWDIIICHISCNIGILNPKLLVYVNMKKKEYLTILKNGYVNHELLLRNNQQCRNIFCEIGIVLGLSPKKMCIEKMTEVNINDFDLVQVHEKLRAPSMSYVESIFLENDPYEIFIALNELAYNLADDSQKNLWICIYWIEWIFQYEKYGKDKGVNLVAAYRNNKLIETKYSKDIVWIIWDIIIESSKKNTLQEKIIQSLFELFCMNFRPSYKQKRKNTIFTSIEVLIGSNVNYSQKIIETINLLENISLINDNIIRQIKKNEIAPNTQYLLDGLSERSQAEKTAEKLQKIQNLL